MHGNGFEWAECQQQALEKAYSVLGEQFEHVVVIVASSHMQTGDPEEREAKDCMWKGGYVAALGLVTFAQHRMLNKKPDEIV